MRERLILENTILVQDGFSQFAIREYNQTFYLWGEHLTNSGKSYTVHGTIPTRFPDERPQIYIHNPNPLWGYGYQNTINSYGISHSMHTLENGPSGEVQMCHWRSDRWHSGITMNKVMLKVVLWLEAYEQHFSSGLPINEFVRTMAEA